MPRLSPLPAFLAGCALTAGLTALAARAQDDGLDALLRQIEARCTVQTAVTVSVSMILPPGDRFGSIASGVGQGSGKGVIDCTPEN